MANPSIEPDRSIPTIHRRIPQYLARRFWQIASTLLGEAYGPYGLLPWQFALLVQLLENPGQDRGWHATGVGNDATSVGQTLDRWTREGLVRRDVNPNDRRAAAYALTPAGEALVAELRPRSREVARKLLAPLSDAEAETLLTLLARVVETLDPIARPGAGRRPPRRSQKAD